MNPDLAPTHQDDQLRDLVAVLRRRRWLIASVFLLVLGLGVVTIPLTPTNFQAISQVLVEVSGNDAGRAATDPLDRVRLPNIRTDIGAHIGYLQSPAILTQAFSDAGVPLPSLGDETSNVIAVKQEGTSPVLDVTVNLPTADAAARVAQAIPEAYNAYLIKAREGSADSLSSSLQSKFTAAQKALQASEQALEKFRREGGIAVASGSAGEELQARLHQYETQLEFAKATEAGAQKRYDESVKARAGVPKEITNPGVTNAVDRRIDQERRVNDLRSKLSELRVTLTDSSPDVKAVRASLANEEEYLRKLPLKEIRSQRVLNPELPTYNQRVADSTAALADARAQVEKLTTVVSKERTALANFQSRVPVEQRLLRDITLNQSTVASLSENLESVKSLGRPTQDPVQVLVVTPALQTSPKIVRTLLVSSVLGLVFGLFAALMRDRTDNRIHTLDQVFDASGALPIGQVPSSTKALTTGQGTGRNAVLESYRALRFNLEGPTSDGSVQSVLVASASAGEGRAGLSQNLAMEAATDMRKTILVDADMRTPELHEQLKSQRSPGLTEVLLGTATLDEALVPGPVPQLMFLPSGAEHPNPLELLAGPQMVALHEELKRRADVVIVNSPSLMRYSDGRALAKIVDSVIFVAKRGFTKRDAMRYCVEMLKRAKAHFLGVVLSDESAGYGDTPYFVTE